jgi:hypothetical protein
VYNGSNIGPAQANRHARRKRADTSNQDPGRVKERFMRVIAITAALGAIVLCAGAAGVHAESTSAKEAELDTAADTYNARVENEDQQVVCRWEAQTGSRIKKKVCRTHAAMDAESREGKRFVNKPRPLPTNE